MVDDAADDDPPCLCLQQADHQGSPGRIVCPFVNFEMDRPLGRSDQGPEAAQDLGPGRKEPNVVAFGYWQAVSLSIAP